jgi:hypothetical protein
MSGGRRVGAASAAASMPSLPGSAEAAAPKFQLTGRLVPLPLLLGARLAELGVGGQAS